MRKTVHGTWYKGVGFILIITFLIGFISCTPKKVFDMESPDGNIRINIKTEGSQAKFSVLYEGDTIIHVGKSYSEPVDIRIDGTDKIVSPGFINAHAELKWGSVTRSFYEDFASTQHEFFSGENVHMNETAAPGMQSA